MILIRVLHHLCTFMYFLCIKYSAECLFCGSSEYTKDDDNEAIILINFNSQFIFYVCPGRYVFHYNIDQDGKKLKI